MRLLITGGTGFLGSHLVKKLLTENHEVLVLKRKISDLSRLANVSKSISFFDLENGLEKIFNDKKIDGIIHLATNYGRHGESAATVFEANTHFPIKLLNHAVEAKVNFFINTDTSLDKFLNPYSLSKRQFAEWGKWMAIQEKIKFINIRLEHMYGPDDDESKFSSYVIKSLINNVHEINLTKGEQLRDFIYIDDVVLAYLKLVTEASIGNNSNFVDIGLGSGDTISIKEFVLLINDLTESKTVLNFGKLPYRPGEVMYSKSDNTYLNSIGWQPVVDIVDGLKKTILIEKKK